MASARDMLKNVKHAVILVMMTLMFVVGFTVATPQKAEAGTDIQVAAGWDAYLWTDDKVDVFEKVNSGFVGSIMLGYRVMNLVGVYLEQDLGYIQMKTKPEYSSVKLDKAFKGATLVSGQLFLDFLMLETSFKLGVGSVYLKQKNPITNESNWGKDFALRVGLGLAAKLGSLRVGVGFDYTWGSEQETAAGNDDDSHFISVKGFVGYEF